MKFSNRCFLLQYQYIGVETKKKVNPSKKRYYAHQYSLLHAHFIHRVCCRARHSWERHDPWRGTRRCIDRCLMGFFRLIQRTVRYRFKPIKNKDSRATRTLPAHQKPFAFLCPAMMMHLLPQKTHSLILRITCLLICH